MKTITDKIPYVHPFAIVLTARSIGVEAALYAADFRDTRSLFSRRLNVYLGFRPDVRVIPIKDEFRLINGIWYAETLENDRSLPLLELDLVIKEWDQ